MSLEDWLSEGYLRNHQTNKNEIAQLFAVFEREIADAQVEAVSAEGRFESAYTAGRTMAQASLAASGYRASGEGNHYWTIQSLAFTLQTDADTINKFDQFRRKRNISIYERIGMVSEQEVTEMIALAQELHNLVTKWLEENHPNLIGK